MIYIMFTDEQIALLLKNKYVKKVLGERNKDCQINVKYAGFS